MKKILLLAFLVRLVYFFLIPPAQTPDEIPIFLRVWDTVRQSLGLSAFPNIHYSNNEYYYPPLYFYLGAFLIRLKLIFQNFPSDISHAYLQFYSLLRLTSLVLSMLSLFLITKTLEKLKLSSTVKTSILLFLALLPTFAVFAIYPNHNVLLFFFISLFLYLLPSLNNVYLGTVAGLAMLTKDDGILLVLMYFTFIFLNRIKNWRGVFVFLFLTFIFGGWWYAKNLWQLGWFYDRTLFEASINGFVRPLTFSGYTAYVGNQVLETFLATFGIANNLRLPAIFYGIFFVFSVVALWRAPFKSLGKNNFYRTLFVAFLANLGIFLWINYWVTLQPQGRYFFPSILFLTTTFMAGLKNKLLPIFVFLFGLTINLVSFYLLYFKFNLM